MYMFVCVQTCEQNQNIYTEKDGCFSQTLYLFKMFSAKSHFML